MSQDYSVDFATFCHKGDVHRLYAPGQLEKQVKSNQFHFNKVFMVFQELHPLSYAADPFTWPRFQSGIVGLLIDNIDDFLREFGIDIDKPQYVSSTDKAHHWKYHVCNHLKAVSVSKADYIVFADNDCWMVEQPINYSWVEYAKDILDKYPNIFIVSPNDGEPERMTKRFSQQMFMARVDEFRNADFNQPNWDGNVNVSGGPFPEYWGMLEGRMELYCRATGQYRYVLGPEFRGWHHNRLNEQGLFETDRSKY